MSAGLAAELCYTGAVRLRPSPATLRRYWPSATLTDGTSRGGGYMVGFPELTAPDPIRLLVSFGRPAVWQGRRDLTHTRGWAEAAEVLAGVTRTVTVTEIFGTSFAPADRVRAFTAVVRTLADDTAPVAVWWPSSRLATPPGAEASGVVNVRHHDVTGRYVLDTLGLGPLGLPDLQCVCGALPPEALTAYLAATASSMIDGRGLKAGDVVPGLTPHQRWKVEAGPAFAAPDRPVLTITPDGAA
ncbi:DUF4261 domain-containing protein [Dactylosporangium sp. NPDC049742]|uniref:DUF4261 domain-containing protein n=1 Tax=Dactylosporangium sp. NPDC049742 TaxID=3154737 RepID=UPI0034136677